MIRVQRGDERRWRAVSLRRRAGRATLRAAVLRWIVVAIFWRRRSLSALSAIGRGRRAGILSSAGAILSAFRRRRHDFLPRQFAVIVFVETFEGIARSCDFGGINDSVMICIKRGHNLRFWMTRSLSTLASTGWLVGVLCLQGLSRCNSAECDCQKCEYFLIFHSWFCFCQRPRDALFFCTDSREGM